MALGTDMMAYYAARAPVYERIYAKPERQGDLAVLRQQVPALLADRSVLEIACGTGYWTQYVGPVARRVVATDANEEVLAIARRKGLPNVTWQRADAFSLAEVPGPFSGGLAAFWWSHLRRDQQATFLEGWHRKLAPGARVVLMDNGYVPGSSTPIARCDADGNTYQQRLLPDGSTHEVLKNFPTEAELRQALADYATDITYQALPYYWLVTYQAT